jgi:sulfur-oxidizing protein SoxA
MKVAPVTIFAGLTLAAACAYPLVAHSQASYPELPAQLSAYQHGTEKSGFLYMDASTRAMETDDFSNPGFLWIDKGQKLWSSPDGTNGKSCESCHGAVSSMKGVGAKYPLYDPASHTVIDLEQKINQERVTRMGAAAYKWESPQLVALTAFIKLQSRGMPVAVDTSGPAHPFWEAGKEIYETRRGQLNMSCEECHVQYAGHQLRSDTLSQGQTNGFPLYRLKWQALGSVQKRFRGCMDKIRAKPFAFGSQQMVDLELYVASRGEGLPVETPAVRK